MNQKTLLLNSSFEIIGFISFKKLIKLLVKDKIEVVAEWNGYDVIWSSGQIKYPATVRMKYYVRNVQRKMRFNRKAIFKRDNFICQYCGDALSSADLTLDHIHPRSRGGQSTWINCVSSCRECNLLKGNKTLEEVGFTLINYPAVPKKNPINFDFEFTQDKHPSWKDYFQNGR